MARPDPLPSGTPQPDYAGLNVLSRMRLFCARSWQKVRDVAVVLHPCRFSVFMVLAGGALLFVAAQGRELAVGLHGAPALAQVAFHCAVFLWAFESWYWSRLLLDFTFGLDREHDSAGGAYPRHVAWTIRNGPRAIALGAYGVAWIALALASAWAHLALAVAIGALFYWLLAQRLAITDRLHRMFGEPVRDPTERRPIARLQDLPPFSQVVLWGSFALSVIATVCVVVDPVAFGWALGGAAVPFLGFALIVPVGSLLVYWFRLGGALPGTAGAKGYPVVTMLAVWAVIVGAFVDNHAVRSVASPAGAASPVTRPSVGEAALQWYGAAASASGREAPPLIVIATAGGGLRAAYWTATILGALQDSAPGFGTQAFAISGVSGGSVGATVFATLLADGPGDVRGPACTGMAYECAGQAVLARDFLGPTAASLVFPDLMQRFVPYPVFTADRAAALEQAWERAWGSAGLPADAWTRRTFTMLGARDRAWLPVLLLNGTHVESGKRIITATVRIDGIAFPDAYDFFALASADVRVSTAALNSARFPYISPAGTLVRHGVNVGHVVDGGYFEDFGAVTALQALRAALRALGEAGKWAEPFLIQISNHPELGADELEVDNAARPRDRAGYRLANEALSPPRAFLNTRDARGVLAYKEFLAAVPAHRRAHFRLCNVPGEDGPALGWVLAQPSLDQMRRLARDDTCGNRAEFERVVAAVRGGG